MMEEVSLAWLSGGDSGGIGPYKGPDRRHGRLG